MITVHALLPTQRPRRRELSPDAMVNLQRSLVAQILQRVERTIHIAVGRMFLMDERIARLYARDEELRQQLLQMQRSIYGVAHIVELADVHSLILLALSRRIHPVDDVRTLRVEPAQQRLEAVRAVACAHLERLVLLRTQRDVALLHRIVRIQVGVRRHAQRAVPRSIHLPLVVRAVAHIHTRVEAELAVERRVAVGEQASRQRESAHDDVMLEEETRIGALAEAVVLAVGAADRHPFVLRLHIAVRRTQDMLAAHVDASRRLAEQPRSMSVERTAVGVETVIVLAGSSALLALYKLVVVYILMPVDHRREHETVVSPRLNLRLCRRQETSCSLKLIIILRTVERRRTEVLRRESALPLQVYVARLPTAHVVGTTAAEVAVLRASVALRVASAQLLAHRTRSKVHARVAAERTERSALGSHRHIALGILARNDVDGAAERRRTEHACRSTLENLDALNVGKRNWKIGSVVTRLCTRNIHAIQ